jgi:hypothetical protein
MMDDIVLCNPIREHICDIMREAHITIDVESSKPFGVPVSFPDPASVLTPRVIDLRPES